MSAARFARVLARACLALAAARGAMAADGGTWKSARALDAVLVEGDRLTPFLGKSIRNLALFAVTSHGFEPIPFQIDEREGTQPLDPAHEIPWVYTLGPYAKTDTDGGDLDANDELVFMARDTGPRFAALPTAALATLELEVRDPVSEGISYVYLLEYPHDPPRSTDTYVRLDAQNEVISTTNYFVSFSTTVPISWSNLTLRGSDGSKQQNGLLDRLKIRAKAEFVLGLVEWTVNEEQLHSVPLGYRQGPVRVIRRVANRFEMGLGLESPEYLLDSVYYENAVFLPAYIEVPFEPGFFMKDIQIRISVDFSRELVGWKFVSSRNPNAVLIDGVMSPEERDLDRGDVEWLALFKGEQAFISRTLLLDARFKNVVRGLYYVDDDNLPDPPEGEPGQHPNVGFVLEHFEGATKGSYRTLGEVYFVDHFTPKMVEPFLEMRSKPLTVTAKSLP